MAAEGQAVMLGRNPVTEKHQNQASGSFFSKCCLNPASNIKLLNVKAHKRLQGVSGLDLNSDDASNSVMSSAPPVYFLGGETGLCPPSLRSMNLMLLYLC